MCCRQHALVCNELLRQFWACIPMQGSASKQRSAEKLKDILNRKYDELENFKNAAESSEKQMVGQTLQPIFRAIDAAIEMFRVEMAPKVR